MPLVIMHIDICVAELTEIILPWPNDLHMLRSAQDTNAGINSIGSTK